MIGTEPPAGTELQVGSPVSVLVSSGPAQVRVPDVSGDSQSGAEAALTAVGLAGRHGHAAGLGATGRRARVLSQSPSAGSSVRTRQARSNLTVAKAPNEVAVPKSSARAETQAAAALGGAGFMPSVVDGVDDRSDARSAWCSARARPAATRRARARP